jgi:2-hydroxymuconate-semialdehyde hydrolase
MPRKRKFTFEFEGARVRYLEGGQGFPVLMLHGSGPGASTLGNWRMILEPLTERFQIFAMDLIGFGRSDRKPGPPYFDLDLWIRQSRAMLDRVPGERVGVIGHSLSGALALKLAAIESRIVKVMTTGTMGARFTANEQTVRTWTFPRDRAELRRTAEGLVYDRSLIDEAYLDNREKVIAPVFRSSRALKADGRRCRTGNGMRAKCRFSSICSG